MCGSANFGERKKLEKWFQRYLRASAVISVRYSIPELESHATYSLAVISITQLRGKRSASG
jgi:hypothetical protein